MLSSLSAYTLREDFFEEKFAYIKKKQYLCSKFYAEPIRAYINGYRLSSVEE